MSETEENKALVRKFYEEAWVKGNADAVDEFVAANYVEHGLPTGAEGMKWSITAYRTAFPDWKTTLDNIFAEGEMVTCLWSTRGTHLRDWFGIPRPVTTLRRPGSASCGSLVERWWNCASPVRSNKHSCPRPYPS
jgi:predicted ester cyclase